MADREGFEPSMDLRPCRFSRAVHSTSLPPVHWGKRGSPFIRAAYRFFKALLGFRCSPVSLIHKEYQGLRGGLKRLAVRPSGVFPARKLSVVPVPWR